jgi:3-oxoacyl-[acyl-carrier protein] reductase
MGLLSGKTAIITGASRGIGRACALALAKEGARLGLIARNGGELASVAAEANGLGGQALCLAGDVAVPAFAEQAFGEVEEKLGPVDVLVNNAGVIAVASVAETRPEQWDEVLAVNLRGAFLFAREAVRRMVPRRSGRVISISSISGCVGTAGLSAYCASKWGLNGLIKTLAEELRGTGVLSMGVAPGSVDTEMLRMSGFEPDMQPEEIATVVRFLACEAPPGMQGSVVEVFG